MSSSKEYDFENFEQYYGDVKTVKKAVEDCPNCGFKLFFMHHSDFSHLVIKETASCSHCDFGQRKVIHRMN